MRPDKIIYKLVVEDVQYVAQNEIGRKLTDIEISAIVDLIVERIHWYDAIAYVINKKFPISYTTDQ